MVLLLFGVSSMRAWFAETRNSLRCRQAAKGGGRECTLDQTVQMVLFVGSHATYSCLLSRKHLHSSGVCGFIQGAGKATLAA
jgi:hypothetical protein